MVKTNKKNRVARNTNKKSQKKIVAGSRKSVFKMMTKYKGDENIPKFNVRLLGGNNVLEVDLAKHQQIGVAKHSLATVDSHIKIETRSHDGFFKGLLRKMFTGETIFKSFYEGTSSKGNKLSLTNYMPSSGILCIKVLPGESYRIANESLLAYTPNLGIATKGQFKNIFVEQGMFQVVFYNNTAEPGMLWLASYGGHQVLNIKSGESKKIAHGLFLCTDANLNYHVSTLSGAKSFFFGTTGTLMEFQGPCQVYLNNKNMGYLVDELHNKLSPYFEPRNSHNHR